MSKWKVYISSTFQDLKDLRAFVLQLFQNQLSNNFELCQVMERMYDEGKYARFEDDCIKAVKASDIYIIILGNKTGSYPPGANRTYTEIELDTAITGKKHIFCMALSNFDEALIDNPQKHREILSKFDGRPQHRFNDAKELETILYKCLLQFASGSPVNSTNPYMGLAPFQVSGGQYFFGRDAEIEACIKKIISGGHRFISVIGNSGIGKTSFVQAGILHRLKEDQRLGFSNFRQLIVTPGNEPYTNLVYQARLKGLPMAGNGYPALSKTILYLNQLEEVITQCTSPEAIAERNQLFDFLNTIASEPPGETDYIVLASFRSDFLSPLASFEFIRDHQYLFPLSSLDYKLMTASWEKAIHEIITKPAARNGVSIEPILVSQLTNEIKDVEGSLPILQFALHKLWTPQIVEDRVITASEFSTMSDGKGISGLIQLHAQKVIDQISKSGTDHAKELICKSILVNLVQVNNNAPDVRRTIAKQALFEQLAHFNTQEVQFVFEALVSEESRLLTVHESGDKTVMVDIIHEVLIRKWEQLKKWVDERRAALTFKENLLESAQSWQDNHCDPEQLLGTKRLQAALSWQEDNRDLVTPGINHYIAMSGRKEELVDLEKFSLHVRDWDNNNRPANTVYSGKKLRMLKIWAANNADLVTPAIQAFINTANRRQRITLLVFASVLLCVSAFTAGRYYYQQKKLYAANCYESAFMKTWIADNPGINPSEEEWMTIKNDQQLPYLTCFDRLKELDIDVTNFTQAAVYLSRLDNLTYLDIDSDTSVINIELIRKLSKLEELSLSGPMIDLSAIGQFKALRDLSIDAADTISGFEKIAGLNNLKMLRINEVARPKEIINLIAQCTQVEHLEIDYLPKADLSVLAGLKHLRYLNLGNIDSIAGLSVFRELTMLDTLILSDIPGIDNLQFLEQCPALKYFSLNNMKGINSLAGVEHCNELRYLDVYGEDSLEDISAIGALTKIRHLSISLQNIPASQAALIGRLPLESLMVEEPGNPEFIERLQQLKKLTIRKPGKYFKHIRLHHPLMEQFSLSDFDSTFQLVFSDSLKNLKSMSFFNSLGTVNAVFETAGTFHPDSLAVYAYSQTGRGKNNIADYRQFGQLPALRKLTLGTFDDFSGLRYFPFIKKLKVEALGEGLLRIRTAEFKGLTSLEELAFNCVVEKTKIDSLKNILPNCKISAREVHEFVK